MEGHRSPTRVPFEELARLSADNPLELLMALPEVVPEVGKALWNDLRLGATPNILRIRAVTRDANGDETEDAQGSAAIEEMWNNLPDEVGGMVDVLGQNIQMTLFTGMCALEAVPGPRMAGISEVWPVNPLTLRFKRGDTGILELWQRQWNTNNTIGGYIPMPMDRFFWASLDGVPGDPHGRAPYAPVLAEFLVNLAFIRDLAIAWHRVGMPRYDIGFDFEMFYKIGREIMQITDDKELEAWVKTQFDTTVAFFNNLAADDAFFHDKNAIVKAIGSGDSWSNVDPIHHIFQSRLVTSLKQMPTLMGIVTGKTETWSTVEWQIYANGLEAVISKAAATMVKASQLHLRLLGLASIAEPVIEPIRSNQRLQEAQAEQIEIANAAEKRDQGWMTQDDASQEVIGHPAVTEPVDTAPEKADTGSSDPADPTDATFVERIGSELAELLAV